MSEALDAAPEPLDGDPYTEDPYAYGAGEDAQGYRARRTERYRAARAAERAAAAAAAPAPAPEDAALGYKDSGNTAYGAKDYLGAAGLYTLALEALPAAAPSCLAAAAAAAAAASAAAAAAAEAAGEEPQGAGGGGGGSSSSSDDGDGGSGQGAAAAAAAVALAPAAPPPPPLPQPTATEALRATCLCNRAACYVAMQQWEEALWDCDRALELKPVYAKAHARRAAALEHLGLLDEALADVRAAAAQDPASAQQLARDEERVRKLVEERDEKLKVGGAACSAASCLAHGNSLSLSPRPRSLARAPMPYRMTCLVSSRTWATACWASLACPWTTSRP